MKNESFFDVLWDVTILKVGNLGTTWRKPHRTHILETSSSQQWSRLSPESLSQQPSPRLGKKRNPNFKSAQKQNVPTSLNLSWICLTCIWWCHGFSWILPPSAELRSSGSALRLGQPLYHWMNRFAAPRKRWMTRWEAVGCWLAFCFDDVWLYVICVLTWLFL